MGKQRTKSFVDLDLDLVREMDSSWIVSDGEKEYVLPKSNCEYDGDGKFTMPEWLALDRGLI